MSKQGFKCLQVLSSLQCAFKNEQKKLYIFKHHLAQARFHICFIFVYCYLFNDCPSPVDELAEEVP